MTKRIYNQQALFGPLYAYLVVLSPPVSIREELDAIKKQMNAIVALGDKNLHAIGHITLFEKLTDETEIAQSVKNLLKEEKSFSIKLKGIRVFKNPKGHDIVLNVANTAAIQNLLKNFKVKSSGSFLSLAKRLDAETILKLQPFLNEFNREFEWHCQEVTVLRKLMSEKEKGFNENFTIPLLP